MDGRGYYFLAGLKFLPRVWRVVRAVAIWGTRGVAFVTFSLALATREWLLVMASLILGSLISSGEKVLANTS